MPAYSPVLIVGATGKQGSAVVRALLAQPNPPQIRALSRKPSSPAARKLKSQGVEVVRGDLTDPQSLEEALVGIRSAFLVTTRPAKGHPAEDAQGLAFIAAAKRANLAFLVFSSVTDATPTIGIPHFETKARIEEGLRESGIEWAVVAPVMFMDNFPTQNNWMLFLALGFFHAVFGSQKLQLVSTNDIGYVAATMLSNPATYSNRRLNLASDVLSTCEIQSTYSRILNQPVWSTWMPSFVIYLIPDAFRRQMRWMREVGSSADVERCRWEFPELQGFEGWLRERVGGKEE
ncbi:Temperature associated repressor [Rhodotorula toruloides ATCC 204091]|uniref:Temperature associated repressor n=1 Tax=Rhodotorula toruloides TaxID=5286 RepID=A0A0K3CUY8_RHOTO|nr:Temperature associated repressor [Rhodotorula toruloides ATCC 204091]KAK4335884.1 Temperature associated repressor [Rhodotorula toruloides]PRQ70121.1 temperature associated repressor [Rhodotorula toruloides]